MKTFLSHLLSFLFIALSASVIPSERLLNGLLDTDHLVQIVRESRTYDRLADLLADTLSRLESARSFSRTPLAFSTDDIRSVLVRSFPEDWFLNQLRLSHCWLLEDPSVRMKGSVVGWVVSDRKELVLENLMALASDKLASLPPCDKRDATRMAPLLASSDRLTRMEDLVPHCRPPGPLEKKLMDRLRKPLASWLSALPDTMDIRKITSNGLRVEGSLDLHSADRYAGSFTLAGYLLLLLSLAGMAAVNLDDRPRLLRRLSFALLWSGAMLSSIAGPAVAYFSQGPPSSAPRLTDGSVQSAALGFLSNLVRVFALDYFFEVLWIGVVLAGTGLLLWLISRFGIKQPGAVE